MSSRAAVRSCSLTIASATARVLLLLLIAVGSVAARQPQLTPGQIPTFQLRLRMMAERGTDTQSSELRFGLAIDSHEQVRALAGAWSEWLHFGATNVQAILTKDRRGLLRAFPVPILVRVVSVQGAKVNAGKALRLVDIQGELRFDETSDVVPLQAKLFGPTLGILLWRDPGGKPQAATMAQYNERYWGAFEKIKLPPSERPKKFPVVDRFLGGDDDARNWEQGLTNLASLGDNVLMLPPSPYLRDILLRVGLHRTAWAVNTPPGGVLGIGPEASSDAIEGWARKQSAAYSTAGYSARDMAVFKLSDEPSWYFPAALNSLAANPDAIGEFREYIKEQQLSPGDLDAGNWREVNPIGQSVLLSPRTSARLGLRRRFYWSVRFLAWKSSRHCSRATRALESAFYTGLPIFTNWNFFSGRLYVPGPVGHNPDPASIDDAMGSQDWFEFAQQKGGTYLWTEDWFRDSQASQWSFYAAKLRSAARKTGLEFGGYVIPGVAGDLEDGVLQRVLSIIGGGGKAIFYYVFGPSYNFPGNGYSERPDVLHGIAQANAAIAAAEDLLWPGQPVQPQVAILAPRSSEVWDLLYLPEAARTKTIQDATNYLLNTYTVDYMAEVFDLYLGLQHSNVPADFVAEDDLSVQLLSPYKVLYVTEPDLPIEAQRSLLEWVNSGGTLVLESGAALGGRYDEPVRPLRKAFDLDRVVRDRLLVRNLESLKPVARITGGAVAFGARDFISSIPGKVVARFDDGSSAVVECNLGKGRLIYFAWMPGLSYACSALPGSLPTDSRVRARVRPGTQPTPDDYSPVVRKWITFPTTLAHVEPAVRVNVPMVETPLLESSGGAAVILLNWSGRTIRALDVSARLGFTAGSVTSLHHGQIPFRQSGQTVTFQLPLDSTDILAMRR